VRASEVRALKDEQLLEELDNAQRELMNLRFQLATRQLQNTSALGKTRKKIARIKTIIRERGLSEI